MILILSKSTDVDTDFVIEWLHFLKEPFIRINDEELMTGLTSFYYETQNYEKSYFIINDCKYFFEDIKVVWFRKFGFLLDYESKLNLERDLLGFLFDEFKILRDLILNLLKDKIWLHDRVLKKSKLEVLEFAKKSGLDIPNTIITNNKKTLLSFSNKNKDNIITKPLAEAKYIILKNNPYSLSTKKVTNIDLLDDSFSPSLFQEYIEKEIEIRVFFICGILYSMAIFSQSNDQTKIDFRAYDWTNPNRFIPYQLPVEIEKKL